jgi:catechol 2,3-dioxygenase-like lactoylglutathione lyase family enzyme
MSTNLTPNLMTEDVNASVKFYCERLGLRFLGGVAVESETLLEQFAEDEPLQWAMLGSDGPLLMFQQRESLAADCERFATQPLAASAGFYLETDDLDGMLGRLGEGVEILVPERITFYGMREVWILDNNGYVLTLAQKVA